MKNGKGLRNGDFLHTENTQLTSCLTGLDFAKQVNLWTVVFFKKNGPTPASFTFIFALFKQTIQVLQQINVKKCHVHPVSSAGIQTHDLWNMSLLPQPLDQWLYWQ